MVYLFMRCQRKLNDLDPTLECPNPKCTKKLIKHNNIEVTICSAWLNLITTAQNQKIWRL